MKIQNTDTIVGIATARGISGINVIRLSGSCARTYLQKCFQTKSQKSFDITPKTVHYGWIYDENKNPIDEVIAFFMQSPQSYTTEDLVEIQTHGGYTIAQTIVDLLIHFGARLALAGEFTRRAFLNGRIDLTQAEATLNLIQAKQVTGSKISAIQLKGKLYYKIMQLKQEVAEILALLNANIDFIEEDISFIEENQIQDKIEKILREVEIMLEGAKRGTKIISGYKVVLAGQPNAGKSSIMNKLLKSDRSIVTDIPGTTRDYIEEFINIKNVPISLIDTAGIRNANDVIEKEGIERSKQLIQQADLVLLIIDSSNPIYDEDILNHQSHLLYIFNKNDLQQIKSNQYPKSATHFLHICSHQESDIEQLENKIVERLIGSQELEFSDVYITNLRQKDAVENAYKHLRNCVETIHFRKGEEFLAVDLSLSVDALSSVVGEITSEDLLDQIFSNFCIGK